VAASLRHIVCPHCDSVNRTPANKPAREAKCGRCHKAVRPLPYDGAGFVRMAHSKIIPVQIVYRSVDLAH
jgi:thioredoxin 2